MCRLLGNRTAIAMSVTALLVLSARIGLSQSLTYHEVKAMAQEMLETGTVDIVKPVLKVMADGRIFGSAALVIPAYVTGVGFGEAAIPLEQPVLSQMKIDLYRRHLFSDQKDRDFFEQYFRLMEDCVSRQVALIKGFDGSHDQLKVKLREQDILILRNLEKGLKAWALWAGYQKEPVMIAAAKAPSPRLLRAPDGARIDYISEFSHYCLEKTKEPIDRYPWQSLTPDTKVQLLGIYYFRLTLRDGQREYVLKRVSDQGDEIVLP